MKLKKTVYVFDLDDTLYPEITYLRSGVAAVQHWIHEVLGIHCVLDVPRELIPMNNSLTYLRELAGLPDSIDQTLLWIYRLHRPTISLPDDSAQTIKTLNKAHSVAIITDGRIATQTLKLNALGLQSFKAYISEATGHAKPHPASFQQVMKDMPATKHVYVGDNPAKDFISPNVLGWDTFCLIDNGQNIHSQNISATIGETYRPGAWIKQLRELL